MADLVLYRKYRPHSFAEALGQDHIIKTLIGALAAGRISHAYLFTGPRGVGKTSVARLLAQAVNCLGNPKPCGECAMCQIALGANTDIIEIDAASNRRIEEMRDLRDKINLSPNRGTYKVYIIDEVHMLTTEAFNALLKTLEEPPAHAIFILATTEAHKIPATIVSRTQQFHFKPITQLELEHQLTAIAKKEAINIEPAAITLLARQSGGGFRDALSLLDQVRTTSKNPLAVADIEALLGVAPTELVDRLVTAVDTRQPQVVLQALDTAASQGIQPVQLALQLIDAWRQRLSKALSEPGSAIDIDRTTQTIEQLASVPRAALPDVVLESSLVRLAMPARPQALAEQTAPTAEASPVSTPAYVASAPTAPAPGAKAPVVGTDKQVDSELWPKVLLLIKAQNNSLYALLCSCRIELQPGTLLVTSRFGFHRDRLVEPKNREIIEAALLKVYGTVMHLRGEVEAAKDMSVNNSAELVGQALEILGGEIVDG